MAHRITRTPTTILALTLLSANLVHAQDTPPKPTKWIWDAPQSTTWSAAQKLYLTDYRVLIFTTAQPTHGQPCHIQSVDANQILCSRHFGRKPRVCRADDIAALIEPGDHTSPALSYLLWAALQAGSIEGAIILMAISTPGGVDMAVVAAVWFISLPGVAMTADERSPDRLVYLAPGQQLHFKLRNSAGHPSQLFPQ